MTNSIIAMRLLRCTDVHTVNRYRVIHLIQQEQYETP